jgi:large subunit ribosomal protein L25
MAEALLVAERRNTRGKREAARLRKKGLVPAVLYGHKEETISLTLNQDELSKTIRHGVRVLDLKADGKTEKALIRDVHWDHLGIELLHVDFARVAADERIVVMVPIELRGIAPGVAGGGVLDQPLHRLSVECLAIAVPESIRVNIGELQLGGVIHVRELALPAGVKAMAEPDAVVVHVTLKQAEPEAPAAAAAPTEAAEPEVIGRQRTEEEESE